MQLGPSAWQLFGWWLAMVWLLLALRLVSKKKPKRSHVHSMPRQRQRLPRRLVAWFEDLAATLTGEQNSQFTLPWNVTWHLQSSSRCNSKLILLMRFVLQRDRNLLIHGAKYALAGMLLWCSFNAVLLYARTGSWLEKPYEWYSLETTGRRVFGQQFPLPSTILHTCGPLRSSGNATAWSSNDHTSISIPMTRLDQLQVNVSSRNQPKTVFVIAFGPTGVISLQPEHMKPSIIMPSCAPAGGGGNSGGGKSTSTCYQIARPVENLTFFTYVWHFLMRRSPDKAQEFLDAQMLDRQRFDQFNLTFVLVKDQQQLMELPAESHALAVVQAMHSLLPLLETRPDLRVGFFALSRENCNNPSANELLGANQIRFGMIPYGDCFLVDHRRFSIVPLGPKFEHGFPLNVDSTSIPTLTQRSKLLNLMVSFTTEKPTRMQALMAGSEVCKVYAQQGFRCSLEQNDMWFKALEKIDSKLHLNLRFGAASASSTTVAAASVSLTYVNNLKDSIFTLCPMGKNPEQYRIWEALAAGSIPIVEDLALMPGTFWHPSYPTSWRCLPQDVHRILKVHGAPVLFVQDWARDLPPLVDYYVNQHPDQLQILQARTIVWYREYFLHLQAQVISQTMAMFD